MGLCPSQTLAEFAVRTTRQISVTLPEDMAARVKAKVASGEYASESEVIRDGSRALQARDHAVDDWLRRDVMTIYDAMKADPTRARSINQVRAALEAVDKCVEKPA